MTPKAQAEIIKKHQRRVRKAAPKIEAQDNPDDGSAISFAQARSFMQRLMQRSGFANPNSVQFTL